jgi:ribose-phosphate pyrophosphokinase
VIVEEFPLPEPVVFATEAYGYLGLGMAREAGWECGAITRKTFPDGEHYRRIDTDPAHRDVVLVGGTIDDANTLELYDLACGPVMGGAYRLRLVIPFFGYSTMEVGYSPATSSFRRSAASCWSEVRPVRNH